MAIRAKPCRESSAPGFSKTFVGMIETFGRSYELGLASIHYLSHYPLRLPMMLPMAFGLLTKGRMILNPHRIKQMDQLTAILDKAKTLELPT